VSITFLLGGRQINTEEGPETHGPPAAAADDTTGTGALRASAVQWQYVGWVWLLSVAAPALHVTDAQGRPTSHLTASTVVSLGHDHPQCRQPESTTKGRPAEGYQGHI
jgi:hypothetical protein